MAGYFRASMASVRAIADASADPDVLAAWLVLRRFAFGSRRELTAAGAKKIAAALSITRPRAAGLLRDLLAIRWGERGELAVLLTARDWNEAEGPNVPENRGNAPVYVMPDASGDAAYLSDLLIPPGEARSYLADLTDLEASQGLDALRVLLLANAAMSCGDYIGADPQAFACTEWRLDGDQGEFTLGYIGCAGGRHYWAASELEQEVATWQAIESATGGRTEAHAKRFWAALRAVAGLGLLCRIAIVSDRRGRLLYPLWVYGESHRARLESLGIVGNLASRLHRQATRAGFEAAELLAFEATNDDPSGLFICATTSETPPTIRTVYAPTFIAPTPDNLAGMVAVAALSRKWA